jgi:hypothetical protein
MTNLTNIPAITPRGAAGAGDKALSIRLKLPEIPAGVAHKHKYFIKNAVLLPGFMRVLNTVYLRNLLSVILLHKPEIMIAV